jgi:hypothetical protein
MTATSTGLSPAQIVSLIQAALVAHRDSLFNIAELYQWTSGLAVADMEAAGDLSAADAATYLSAVADAYAEYQNHLTGVPPSTYPQPTGQPYPYGASQARVIGPIT